MWFAGAEWVDVDVGGGMFTKAFVVDAADGEGGVFGIGRK